LTFVQGAFSEAANLTMTESHKYTGKAMDRRYVGQAVDITYSLKRCLHAEQCVRHLTEVFTKDRRPWINADGAAATEVARVVPLCPSGALHFESKDGTTERVPEENVIRPSTDGPLYVQGDLAIVSTTVDVHGETRAALCRCGASKNKPFCDNSHQDIDFVAPDSGPEMGSDESIIEANGTLTISPETNGPLAISGKFKLISGDGEVIQIASETWLCRCGHSEHKPFCDNTHQTIGFQAE
jgi:CDGSH-type Zn-finger protein/uncharacterized Fe-S cluster protein YjdI